MGQALPLLLPFFDHAPVCDYDSHALPCSCLSTLSPVRRHHRPGRHLGLPVRAHVPHHHVRGPDLRAARSSPDLLRALLKTDQHYSRCLLWHCPKTRASIISCLSSAIMHFRISYYRMRVREGSRLTFLSNIIRQPSSCSSDQFVRAFRSARAFDLRVFVSRSKTFGSLIYASSRIVSTEACVNNDSNQRHRENSKKGENGLLR